MGKGDHLATLLAFAGSLSLCTALSLSSGLCSVGPLSERWPLTTYVVEWPSFSVLYPTAAALQHLLPVKKGIFLDHCCLHSAWHVVDAQ